MIRTPRFTDKHRFGNAPYADAKASSEPNYLRDKFRAIAERQAKDAAEAKEKVRALKKAAK